MNKQTLSILGLVVVCGGAVWWWTHSQSSSPKVQWVGGGTISFSGPAVAAGKGQVASGGAAVATGASMVPPASEVTVSDREFEKWLEREAKEVDLPKIDAVKKKHEIEQAIAHLNPAKARQLLQTVQSPKASAGAKILSAYLLVEAGPKTETEIRELLSTPMPSHGESAPHSEAELRNTQDRSLRIMAIDGLASRAKTDARARETLADSISGIQDSYIKNYAQKRLDEVRTR